MQLSTLPYIVILESISTYLRCARKHCIDVCLLRADLLFLRDLSSTAVLLLTGVVSLLADRSSSELNLTPTPNQSAVQKEQSEQDVKVTQDSNKKNGFERLSLLQRSKNYILITFSWSPVIREKC